MTIAFRSIGTVGTGTTSVTAGLPASLATGDGVLLFVETKPDTATIGTPTGWTLVADVAGGGGTTGQSVGPTRQAVFFREKTTGWSTMPAVTVTNGNATAAAAVAYSKASTSNWQTAAATGVYGTSATTTNGASTLGSNPGITAGDWCVVGYSSMVDTPAWSAQGITATGITTWGTATERSEVIETTTGNDVGGMVFDRPVTTGTATAAPATQATASVATRGTVALVRLREVAATVQYPAAGTVDAVSDVSGSAGLLPAGTYVDDFNRADGALGANWVSTVNAPTIASNQVVAAGTGQSVVRYATATPAGEVQFSEGTYRGGLTFGVAVALTAFGSGVGVGSAGVGGYYALRHQTTATGWNLIEHAPASVTNTVLIGSSDPGITGPTDMVAGDVIRLEYGPILGDGVMRLRGFINGVQLFDYVPATPLTGQQYVGLSHNAAGTAGQALLDDWRGGSYAVTQTSQQYPAAGTVDATSTVSASTTARLVAGGSVAATSTTTASTTARLAASGSVAATTTVTGAAGVITAAGSFPAAGTVDATTTVTGAATARLAASGTVPAVSTVSASTNARLGASGTAAATSTASASATSRLPASGSVAATSSTTASAASLLPTSGTVAATSGATGSTAARLPAAGTVAATSAAVGAAATLLPTSGTIAATSTVAGSAGTLAGAQQYPAAGTVAATTTAVGAATARLAAAGTVSATSSTSGSASTVAGAQQYPAAGTVAATSSVTGSAGVLRAAAGTANASSATSGAATLRLPTGGTVTIGSGTSAAVTQYLAAAGTVAAEVVLTGSATSTFGQGAAPASPDQVFYVAAEDATLRVGAEDSTLRVIPEPGYVVAAEDSTYYVAADVRALIPT